MADQLRPTGELNGIDALRLEQAKRLQNSVVGSCWTVEAVIAYIAILIIADGQFAFALAWTIATSAMVLVVYVYSRKFYVGEIDRNNYQPYLRGHVWISGLTGSLWAGFAIYQFNPDSLLSLYIAASIASTITLGGMFPSSAYRSTFIALLTCNVVPVGIYWFIVIPGPTRFFAFGFIVYYIFGLMTSARTEINLRDLILAEQATLLNDELQSHNQEIEDSNTEKTRFMVATVHDFSQPQHALGYFIHGLRRLLTDEKQFEMLDRIESSWRSQGELLKGIAEISQLDSGLISPRIMNVEIESVLSNVAAEFNVNAQEKNITFNTPIVPTIVETDPALLARVVRNLLSNAFKHTPAGGVVTLSNTLNNDQALIEVSDNGSGISEEDQTIIFDEYVQLKNGLADSDRGLGLGLSIVKRLSPLIGIDVQLSSSLGQGSTFSLRLECTSDQTPQIDEAESPPPMSSTPTIFLVEPDLSVQVSMRDLLVEWGCDVTCALSKVEAVASLGELSTVPNLLIINNRLPDEELGIDLVGLLRDEVNERVPVVLMTGDIESLAGIDPAEDVTIMTKPVQPDELRGFIRSRQAADETMIENSA